MRNGAPDLIITTPGHGNRSILRILRLQIRLASKEQKPLDSEQFAYTHDHNRIVGGGNRPVHHDDIAIPYTGSVRLSLPLVFRFEGVDRAGQGNDLHREQKRSVLDCAPPRLDSFVSDHIERRCFRW